MSRFRHGLVIGKFYPPHAGHHHLIDTAAADCDRLSVIVAASTVESIPLADRAGWLRETHPQPHVDIVPVVDDVKIDYDSDRVWAAHVQAFTGGLAAASGSGIGAVSVPGIDAVFTSEEYGPELARRFDAVHVPVDPGRERFPVSGTAVRRDPVGHWQWLAPPVRAALTRRIAVVGAESCGTTTLARALAAHYATRGGPWAATRWVPEYGRTYCEEKLAIARRTDPGLWIGDLIWDTTEFTTIAERHLALTQAAARTGSPVLICDTDAFATILWHERYLRRPAPQVEAVHARARHDLWIHTGTAGIPFHQDGWRDGRHVREAMSARFAEELTRRGLPHLTVSGTHRTRLDQAVTAIDELLSKGWHFTEPL